MEIEISIMDDRWRALVGVEQKLIDCAQDVLMSIRPDQTQDLELSLVLGSDKLSRELNQRYRDKDRPTNVLSFPALEHDDKNPGPALLGDVILAYETIDKQAKVQAKTLLNHACHLTIHGVLHLLGFDHDGDINAAAMEKLEIDILKTHGIENPYLITDIQNEEIVS